MIDRGVLPAELDDMPQADAVFFDVLGWHTFSWPEPWNLTFAIALAVIAAVNSVIAFVYYARVVKSAWFDPVPEDVLSGEAKSASLTPTLGLALGITAAGVLVVGIFPSVLSELGEMTKVFVAGF